jgi:ribosomal protein L21
MDYVIVQMSGKQFILKRNNWYDFDFIKNLNLEENQIIYLNKVLLLKKKQQESNFRELQIGKPFLSSIKIALKFLQNIKKKKILVLKTKPKKKYTRLKGHRKLVTRLKFI